ncbi:hypothetical protein EFM07_07315 [Lactococcus lactis]|nr:hypothetical protein [Lactococcus lactis]
MNSSRKSENKKTDKNEKNTDGKSVSIFSIRRFNAHFARIELSVFFHLVSNFLSDIISISKKLAYSVKFLSFLKTKNLE